MDDSMRDRSIWEKELGKLVGKLLGYFGEDNGT